MLNTEVYKTMFVLWEPGVGINKIDFYFLNLKIKDVPACPYFLEQTYKTRKDTSTPKICMINLR